MDRRRRRACCRILIIAGIFWAFIIIGFRHQNTDLDFGEHLDGAHSNRLKQGRAPFLKNLNEMWAKRAQEKEGQSELSSNEKKILVEFLGNGQGPYKSIMDRVNQKRIESEENKILKEFLNRKTTKKVEKEEAIVEIVDIENKFYGDIDPLITADFRQLPNPEKIQLMRSEIDMLRKNLPQEHIQLLLDELDEEEKNVGQKPAIQDDTDYIPSPGGPPDITGNEENPVFGPENNDLENLEHPVESRSASNDSIEKQTESPVKEPESHEKLGEYGKAVTLPLELPDNIKTLVDEGWKNHEFNEYVSSLISPQRDLHDFRSDYCKDAHRNYSSNLPSVSIVIVFYNEAWSTLLRSIYSILNRTPMQMVKEIILVDDFSEFEHLKTPLDEFVKQFQKVRIIRNTKREGLIQSRNRGALEATAEILVFLDSHIECTIGWLEPLIERINKNSTTVTVPIVEGINATTFEISPHDHPHYVTLGGFHWNMKFHWFYVESKYFKNTQDPLDTPTISGGLFAINKNFFLKLGMFDPDLRVWGSENLELSFKTWMCGGKMEIIPCSHVGHVFRTKSPYKWEIGPDIMRRNSMRVAQTWMDDYAVFFNFATGFDKVDFGDISGRLKIKNDLNCKNFGWYLKNIYPQRTIPDEGIAYGEIKNLGYGGKMCLNGKAVKEQKDVKMKGCHGHGRDQFWMYNEGEIERDNYCLTYDHRMIYTKHCRKDDKQMFTYNPETQQLYINSIKLCLTMNKKYQLNMEKCDNKNEGQKWKLEHLKNERVKIF